MSVFFEKDIMATNKRSKETSSDFIARILSAEHFNFKHYSILKGGNLNKYDFQLKQYRTFSF